MVPLTDFAASALAEARERFVAASTSSFLVVEKYAADQAAADSPATMKTTSVQLKANLVDPPERFVVPIVKASGLPPEAEKTLAARFVSLGRTSNNDIVLTSPFVSKTHLLFRPDTAGQISCYDTGSTNGTTFNGARLKPNEGVPLKNGDELLLSGVILATYFTPGGLYDYLGVLMPKKKAK